MGIGEPDPSEWFNLGEAVQAAIQDWVDPYAEDPYGLDPYDGIFGMA